MRQLIVFTTIILAILSANALTIPQGTFYFDNSKTLYSHVKFVYGSDANAETYVVSMQKSDENQWKVTFDKAVNNMYRYTFANTTLPDGKINDTFSNVKENISNSRIEKRTATTDKTILVNGIFVPESGDNWAQGSWQPLSDSNAAYSETLPVLFINTQNGAAITSKETYINATYYLDAMGIDGIEPIGSKEQQLDMEIRGRGNYTWRDFEKKPYRIKLGKKQSLLGMNKSRHFVLLADADDNFAHLRNSVGFELSRRLGLKYTPAQQPVEVVLNGNYIGLYMLAENIRVAKDRVNIVEQADYCTHPDSITGGWIIEIDNYEETEQVRITEGNGEILRFTYKSPELLSDAQRNYLTSQVKAIDRAVYVSDKSSTEWENLVDIDSLARFYIVQEIMDNAESFHGSCYIHKDFMADRWIFGPVWDFGNSYRRNWQEFIYQNPPFGQNWIGEMAKFPRFQAKVIEVWQEFRAYQCETLHDYVESFISAIETATVHDYKRWPQYGTNNIHSVKNSFLDKLDNRIDWLVSQWGDTSIDQVTTTTDSPAVYYNLQGHKVDNPTSGIYIKVQNNCAVKVFIR